MTNPPKGYSAAAEVNKMRERRSQWQIVKLELSKAPYSAWFGILVILAYFFVALFAPLLAPHGEAEIFTSSFAPWGGEHIFGTDQIGRDIFHA